MRIVLLSVWYSEKMGYAENCLPKALAAIGHDVTVITSTAQVYYNHPDYNKMYKPYLGESIQEEGTKIINGFKLIRLPFVEIGNKIYIKSIGKQLKIIQPDIVQSFDPFSFLTLLGAVNKIRFGYKFFTANHTHESVFPYMSKEISILRKIGFYLSRTLPGIIMNLTVSRCYPTAIDSMKIATDYYGVPKNKIKLSFLGVDTQHFNYTERSKYIDLVDKRRTELGITTDDLLCIYTGRFTENKNPLCLAQAVNKLVESGEKIKAIFLGNGPQLDQIKMMKGCIVHNFVPYIDLPLYYFMADIGVWPREESTSMLDALSCGLPLIISDKVQAIERIEGNGLTYKENDWIDLSRMILILKDNELRKKYSLHGVKKIIDNYSWLKIAKERIEDYNSFINKR